MPHADGFAVLRKAQEPALRTPVIILTASTLISECVEAMRFGAFNFLVKPCNGEDLKSVVEAALAQGRPARAPRPRAATIWLSPRRSWWAIRLPCAA
jgi:DNA-binding NtrC family response regulator